MAHAHVPSGHLPDGGGDLRLHGTWFRLVETREHNGADPTQSLVAIENRVAAIDSLTSGGIGLACATTGTALDLVGTIPRASRLCA